MGWNSQSGPDESYTAYRPDESPSASLHWQCSGCCAQPTLRTYYYCFEREGVDIESDLTAAALAAGQTEIRDAYPTCVNSFTRHSCGIPAGTKMGLGIVSYTFTKKVRSRSRRLQCAGYAYRLNLSRALMGVGRLGVLLPTPPPPKHLSSIGLYSFSMLYKDLLTLIRLTNCVQFDCIFNSECCACMRRQ